MKEQKIMKKIIVGLILICMVSLPLLSAHGSEADNTVIYFSGILKDSNGNEIESGSYNMAFNIYENSGSENQFWREEFIGDYRVDVMSGQFQVSLGQKNSLILNTEENAYWVGVAVGGVEEDFSWDSEMLPRIPIVSLEDFLLGGSISLSDDDFMDLLIKEFEAQMGEETGLTQADFLIYLQEKLANNNGQAVVISPDSLSRMLDVVMDYEQSENIIEDEIIRAEQEENETGFLRAVVGFFKRTLDTISGAFSQILAKLSTILTKLTGVEKGVGEILTILEKEPEITEIEFENLSKDSGEASILTGNTSVIIKSSELTKSSRIFVSPKTDISGIWWISNRVDGDYFEVSILVAAEKEILLDYWIVGPEESEQDTEEELIVEESTEFSPFEIEEELTEPVPAEEEEKVVDPEFSSVEATEEEEEVLELSPLEIEEELTEPVPAEEEEKVVDPEFSPTEEIEEVVETSPLEVVE
jgi:hypothetical protein